MSEDQLARALPGYRIGAELGRGAYGVVLQAEHLALRRPVAIKELSAGVAADPAVQRRFAGEARLLASLDNPHIVDVFDYVEAENLCAFVMELLSGGTVRDRAKEGVTAEAACCTTLATCVALQYAHDHGILHRDIKPENLLFSASGTLKVTDFGIAKVIGGDETAATRAGFVMGTPSYIAPEQVLGHELTPATDVYALGTVLYELLAGRLPFDESGNVVSLLYRHANEPPEPIRQATPHVPGALADAVMRALATDPQGRYATADDFGVAVADAAMTVWGPGWMERSGQPLLASGPIAARMSGGAAPPDATAPLVAATAAAPTRDATVTSGGSRAAPTPPPLPPPAPPRPSDAGTARAEPPAVPASNHGAPRRRRRRPLVLAAVAVAVVGVVGVVVATQTGSSGPGPSAALPPGRAVFRDDFTNPASGWAPDPGQGGTGSGAYQGGGYQVTVLQPDPALNTFSVASPYTTKLTGLTTAVTATLLSSGPLDGAGVRCDQIGRSGLRYSFETRANGSWLVFKLDGAGQTVVRQGSSPLVHAAPTANTVQGECRELAGGATRLVMTVNGQVVSDAVDPHGGAPIAWHGALVAHRDAQSASTVVRFTQYRAYDAG